MSNQTNHIPFVEGRVLFDNEATFACLLDGKQEKADCSTCVWDCKVGGVCLFFTPVKCSVCKADCDINYPWKTGMK